jgi:hypothetical protein
MDDEHELTAETLHVLAIHLHLEQADDLLAADPTVTAPLRVAVCDALTWAIALRWEIRRLGLKDPPPVALRDDYDHLAIAAYWARNQIAHGRAVVLEFRPDTLGEAEASWDAPLPYDIHLPYDVTPAHPVVRFVEVPNPVPNDKDEKGRRHFYNECLVDRSVVDVCARLQLRCGTPRDA